MMRIAPQIAVSASGYAVYGRDRFHVGYSDWRVVAIIDVDFGIGETVLYEDTLVIRPRWGRQMKTSESVRRTILSRLHRGLLCLGNGEVEFYRRQ